MHISNSAIVRTALLVLALINQFFTILGLNPLPIEDEQLSQLISLSLTTAAALWAWWKNNSFTQNAIKADEYLKYLKEGKD